MKFKVLHQTEYVYERPVHHSIHDLRLYPLKTPSQEVIRWKIQVPNILSDSVDAFGNTIQNFVIDNNYTELMIESKGEIQTYGDYLMQDDIKSVSPYYLLQQTDLTLPNSEMMKFFHAVSPDDWNENALIDLTKKIGEKIEYISGITHSKTKASEAFALKKGVCQDQAHLMISLCRFHGIPARYVSGYLYDESKPVEASHAWVDVCLNIEKGEWLSIDITNQCITSDYHIRLAVGRDYDHVAPVKGVRFGGGQEQLKTKIVLKKC